MRHSDEFRVATCPMRDFRLSSACRKVTRGDAGRPIAVRPGGATFGPASSSCCVRGTFSSPTGERSSSANRGGPAQPHSWEPASVYGPRQVKGFNASRRRSAPKPRAERHPRPASRRAGARRRPDFDLKAYAARSFVLQELLLIVRFHAEEISGMAHHLIIRGRA